ncbi:TNT domain-containing protein [Mycobacterium sp. PDNC021]|uniref:TNT domain-containing protein n=1 Tax=Mycobacterium sp. PDNC021 TaxID=3391399 RepID=UPI003AAEB1B7
MTGPITVDPTALNSAGASVGAESNAVTSAISTLTAALSGHESGFGHDAAAFVFSRSYTNAANALLHSAASAVNASRRTGQGIQMSAYNYGTANAHSTVGGGESPVAKPGDPGKFSAPGVPSVFGGAIAAPIGWGIVEAFVGGVWPDGDPAQMRATAAAWRTFGSSISGGSGAMTAAGTTLGGFQIPEAPQMQKAANDIGGGLTNIDKQAQALAGQIDSFATTVENAQNAIRDLLHQLSPSGILSTIGGMFEGHNPIEKIKQIAHDIDTVLNNMKREANAMDQAVSQGINDLDGLTNKLEAWANKEFVEVFGQEVGGALGADFTALADITEGGFKFVAQTAEGLEQLDPTRFLYDPEGAGKSWLGTAKALGEMALVGDPFTAPLALANPGIRNDVTNLGKSMIDLDDFKNGHPLRGLAYDAAQVGSLIIPGVGEAAPAADAAGGAARVGAASAEAETRVGGTVARDTGAVASRGGAAAAGADEVAGRAGNITKNLDKVGVPEAAPEPSAAGKAPVEPPAAAPKPEAAPVPKPEPAPPPPPTQEAPAPHTSQPTGPSEPHTPAPVEHGPTDHGSPSEHHAGAPSESPRAADGPIDNHPPPPEPSHHAQPSTPPPPVAGHDYGFPPDSAFEHVKNPADDIARLHEGGVPPSVTDGYDPLAGRTEAEFKSEFTTVDGKGRLQWDWDGQAPNNGFDGPPSLSDHIPAGHQLDRLGSNGGGFMGDEGAPLSTRSMPPGVANDYHTFVGTGRPIPDGLNWRVEYGPAKAAFGQPGGAEQWAAINLDTGRPVSIEELKLWRLIRETTGE